MASVVERSVDQRAACAGEAVCVVCGRYGEYVCDVTDTDVCSRECKQRNIAAVDRRSAAPADTTAQAVAARTRHGITVHGVDVPAPAETFAALELPGPIAAKVNALGYATPTPIQMQCLPVVLQGRDLLAGAATGSGKTLAYALGIVCRLWTRDTPAVRSMQTKPVALVLCPTRELGVQIESVCKALMQGLPNMRTALVVGGEPIAPQMHRLFSGVQVIVATPGRLCGLSRLDTLVNQLLGSIEVVVLDEVDEMLRHGFQSAVHELLETVRTPHQTVAFSATIPPRTERLVRPLLADPVLVAVGDVGAAAANVFQTLLWVEEQEKKHMIVRLLTVAPYYRPPVLVFVATRIGTELLAAMIQSKCNLDTRAIHGDMAQADRVAALASFLNGTVPVLVATGLLARGLDLANVATVILFDMPSTVEDYVHQIGRAARGVQPGWAITFLNGEAQPLFPGLLKVVHQAAPGRVSPLPHQLDELIDRLQEEAVMVEGDDDYIVG